MLSQSCWIVINQSHVEKYCMTLVHKPASLGLLISCRVSVYTYSRWILLFSHPSFFPFLFSCQLQYIFFTRWREFLDIKIRIFMSLVKFPRTWSSSTKAQCSLRYFPFGISLMATDLPRREKNQFENFAVTTLFRICNSTYYLIISRIYSFFPFLKWMRKIHYK